jgi:PII-like signaling protein
LGARWPPQLGAGISSVEITELYEVGHQRAALGIKIRFSNKVEAFEKLMRHLELFERNLEEALRMGVRGATLIPAAEGFGRHHRMHSAHFFELADQPLEVTMAVSHQEADKLFARLMEEQVKCSISRRRLNSAFSAKTTSALVNHNSLEFA